MGTAIRAQEVPASTLASSLSFLVGSLGWFLRRCILRASHYCPRDTFHQCIQVFRFPSPLRAGLLSYLSMCNVQLAYPNCIAITFRLSHQYLYRGRPFAFCCICLCSPTMGFYVTASTTGQLKHNTSSQAQRRNRPFFVYPVALQT